MSWEGKKKRFIQPSVFLHTGAKLWGCCLWTFFFLPSALLVIVTPSCLETSEFFCLNNARAKNLQLLNSVNRETGTVWACKKKRRLSYLVNFSTWNFFTCNWPCTWPCLWEFFFVRVSLNLTFRQFGVSNKDFIFKWHKILSIPAEWWKWLFYQCN